MKTLFITATGTEVGKTYVTAALASALTAKGKSVRVLKPVISGFDETDFNNTDTALLLDAAGQAAGKEAVEACSPWRFKEPLSPDMAAKREGRAIDFNALIRFCREAQTGDEDFLLIEGIGGAMVPLDATLTVLDWMAELQAPALVVCGSYLGTLSHTLTTVAALRGRDIDIAGVVVSESEQSPVPVSETVETLQRHLGGVSVATAPRNAKPDEVMESLSEITGP
ncbi:MAG TPA: dethiobiotin synthase [Rhodospirillales bacterium]|nr:dethiobiotin synthase [Rhodospirillales bacterium]